MSDSSWRCSSISTPAIRPIYAILTQVDGTDMRHIIPNLLAIAMLGLAHATHAAVVIDTGLVYATGTVHAHTSPVQTNLVLDVYRPADPADRTGSALVLVHGGGFVSGSRTSADMQDAGTYFAERGWVCFSIDYRLVPDDPPAPAWLEAFSNAVWTAAHAAMVDTKRAVRWVRANAATYGCDTNRVAGLGHSAGAYCVLQAVISDAADCANDTGTPTPDQLPGYAGGLNAGVEVSGGVDLNAAEFDAGDPPLMIWHGDSDSTVPYTEAQEIHGECLDHGIPYRFFTLPGADHGAATWTALYDGRGLKEHAFEFLNLFFALHAEIDYAAGDLLLSWPSLSNAVYVVHATTNLAVPFTNAPGSVLTSRADTCTAVWPTPGPRGFFLIEIRSGQDVE